MGTFPERLRAAMEKGLLQVADLHRWFERPMSTVRTWTEHDRTPMGVQGVEAERRLKILETAIKRRDGLPVPLYLTQLERPKYIEQKRDELVHNRTVPARGTA